MLIEKQVEKTTTTSALAFVKHLKQREWGDIAYKLMYPETGEGWTQEQTTKAIADYLKFLTLRHLYPALEIVPSEEIDRVWHTHILDTQKYAVDCQQVFGSFLHHFPYFGIRGREDRRNLEAAFARTQSLFEEHFGVSMASSSKPSVCVLQTNSKAKPSVCVLQSDGKVKPSVCVLQTTIEQSRPRVEIDLNYYLPTKG